jgi:hypothetical protein
MRITWKSFKQDAVLSPQAKSPSGDGRWVETQASTVLKTSQVILMHFKVGNHWPIP